MAEAEVTQFLTYLARERKVAASTPESARKSFAHVPRANDCHMHYVYVLRSLRDDGLYVGYSANLRRRLVQHNEGAAVATSHRGPWKLIYYEAYLEQVDALGRERYLKSGAGRRFLKTQLRHYLKGNPIRGAA